MTKDQDFPVSIEVQLLGGNGKDNRTTSNLCTPGTNVVMDGKLVTRHCTDSSSATYRGDQWVAIEVEAHANGLVIHRINGKEVIRYEKVQYDPNDKDAQKLIPGFQPGSAGGSPSQLMISGGSISLQSESHPVEFRKIEIMRL